MNGLLSNEVLVWRLAGAAVWQAFAVTTLYITYESLKHPLVAVSPFRALSSIFNFSNWISLVSTLLALAPATAAHTAVISTIKSFSKQRSGFQIIPAKANVLLRKAASRASSFQAAATWLAFFIAHSASASFFYLLNKSTAQLASTHIIILSFSLALAYQLHVLYWSRDILAFPSIQRHRYFRIKQQIPVATPHAFIIALVGCIGGTAASLLAGYGTPSLQAALPVLATSTFCTLCWLVGTVAFEVVFTERLRADDYGGKDALQAMEICLGGKNGVIMRDLALHDLSSLATDPGKGSWRRKEIFADDSGARWRPLAQFCVAEVTKLLDAMAVALPRRQLPPGQSASSEEMKRSGTAQERFGSGFGGTAATGTTARKWNAVPTALVKGMPVAQRQNLDALSAVCCGYQRAKLAIRTLCDFAVASLTQDRFGVVQLVDPTLGDILLCLLSTLLATEQFIKQVGGGVGAAGIGPWRGTGDAPYAACEAHAAVYALRDELSTGMYKVTASFGPSLKEALEKAKGVPVFGSKAEAAALLESFLKGEHE